MLALSSHLNSWLETVDFFANSCMSCTRFYAPHIFVIVNWRLRDCSLVVIVEEIHTEPVRKENEMRTITIERHQKQRWRQQQHWKLNNYDGFSSCNGIFNALWRVFHRRLRIACTPATIPHIRSMSLPVWSLCACVSYSMCLKEWLFLCGNRVNIFVISTMKFTDPNELYLHIQK